MFLSQEIYKGFVEIARPLHRLIEKSMTFKWNTECDESFKILKEYLTASPILTYPCLDKEYILDTDTSTFRVGAVLSQISNQGKECVIAYYSRALAKPERHYYVTRR